jgi:hypothetical protein
MKIMKPIAIAAWVVMPITHIASNIKNYLDQIIMTVV